MTRSRKTLYLFFEASPRLESIFLSYLDIENYGLAHISTLIFDFHKMTLFYTTPMHDPITKNPLSFFWGVPKTREYFFIISRHRELSIGTYFNTDLWLSQNALVFQVNLSCRPFIFFLRLPKTREYFSIISRHRELWIGTYFNTDLWLSQNDIVSYNTHAWPDHEKPFIFFLRRPQDSRVFFYHN